MAKIHPGPAFSVPLSSSFLLLLSGAILFFISLPLRAQTNRNLILLDPAHGASDSGAKLSDTVTEAQLTLAFTAKLRTLLTAANFTVVTTHDADSDQLTPGQRAGLANHTRASACIILHATPTGSGVHLFTSALAPLSLEPSPYAPIPWDSAQAPYLPQSLRLANQLGANLVAAKVPAVLISASVPPLDNLTCPAVVLEISPLATSSSSATPVTDADYQQRIAVALTQALTTRRGKYDPPPPHPLSRPTPPAEKSVEVPVEKPAAPAPTAAVGEPVPARPTGVRP